MKTEVYSWRVSRDLKTDLKREARRRKTSVAAVLDMAARAWLSNVSADEGDQQQCRLQQAAARCFGSIAGSDVHRSENVRQNVRQRLRQRHER